MFDQYAHYLPVSSKLGKKFLVELAAGFANLSNRVIAPSESVRDILIEEGVHSPIDVVPTGVQIETFAHGNGTEFRRSLGIPESSFLMGYAGRLAPEKNLEFLTKTVAGFMAAHENTYFLVAGKGPSEGIIEKIFLDAGVKDRVRFLGVLPDPGLADFYHALNVFVFASKSETQGMVLCEAMAAGIPVIALEAPGVREVVRDYENGRLIDYENETAFQSVLSWFLHQEKWPIEKMMGEARRTAELFSMNRCGQDALAVYEKARSDYSTPNPGNQNKWRRVTRRFRMEWEIMHNIGHAGRLAIAESLNPHN